MEAGGTPHEDIRPGRFDASVFAVDLREIALIERDRRARQTPFKE